MGAKKVTVVFAAVVVVLIAVAGLKLGKKDKDEGVLRIYTWSNYYSDEVLETFTKRTGIKVQISYFSSNEELLAKLKAGAKGYDVIQPSDYMVRQMASLGMLAKIDHGKLPNLKYLDDLYRKVPYDPGNVSSVPFTWGTTGIAVNIDKVKVPTEGVTWKFLMDSPDPKHTSLLDDMREVFAVALRLKGLPINTTESAALNEAKGIVSTSKGRILMFTSEPKALLLKGELNVAHVFSCDAIQANRINPKIRYFLPTDGGTIWTDNVAIPASSEHFNEAHRFLDYLLDPEVAVHIVREKALATVNRAAFEKLTPEERNDPQIYPPAKELKKAQYLEDIGENLQVVSRLWTEVKS